MRDENSVFDKDNNYHKQKEKERHNPVFKRKNSKKPRHSLSQLIVIAKTIIPQKEIESEQG